MTYLLPTSQIKCPNRNLHVTIELTEKCRTRLNHIHAVRWTYTDLIYERIRNLWRKTKNGILVLFRNSYHSLPGKSFEFTHFALVKRQSKLFTELDKCILVHSACIWKPNGQSYLGTNANAQCPWAQQRNPSISQTEIVKYILSLKITNRCFRRKPTNKIRAELQFYKNRHGK